MLYTLPAVVIQKKSCNLIKRRYQNVPEFEIYIVCCRPVRQVGQIQLGASMEINITVQIDPDSTLSVGQHFLTIPNFATYEQHVANGATKMFLGSAEPVTVNFTVREGTIDTL